MKIVFWSEEAACGTTSNMIATASMIVARHNCRVAMLSAEKNAHDLAGNFSRPDSVTVNEDWLENTVILRNIIWRRLYSLL